MNIRQKIKKENVILIVSAIVVSGVFLSVIFSATLKLSYKNNSNQSAQKITKQAPQNSINQQQSVKKTNQEATTTIAEWVCLKETEEAGFYNPLGIFVQEGVAREYPLKVIIREKKNKTVKKIITIDNIRTNYHPIEIYKCGVYVINEINFDKKNFKTKTGYRSELYKYDYFLNVEKLFFFSEKPKEYISYYSTDFRISQNEKYVALEKSYMGQEDYSFIIKDLNTKEDVFMLSYKDILKQYPKMMGTFRMHKWSRDNRYFWGRISLGANAYGYFRIDTKNWTYNIYEAPEGQMGGEKLNVETGWITHHTGLFWTGEDAISAQIIKKRREQGIGTEFYVYNLFTKEKIFIYETDEPDWFTKPKWLSETEVEYEIVGGEKRIYKLNTDEGRVDYEY